MAVTTAMTTTATTRKQVKSDTYGGGSLASGLGRELLTGGLAWL
jgi:hypothetical protein